MEALEEINKEFIDTLMIFDNMLNKTDGDIEGLKK